MKERFQLPIGRAERLFGQADRLAKWTRAQSYVMTSTVGLSGETAAGKP